VERGSQAVSPLSVNDIASSYAKSLVRKFTGHVGAFPIAQADKRNVRLSSFEHYHILSPEGHDLCRATL